MNVMHARLCAAGLLLMLLGGCSLAPEYRPPELPVAEQLPAAQEGKSSPATAKDAAAVRA